MKDSHTVLELARGATQDEIKLAYRRLAKIYHPDRNPGDPTAEEHFKDIVAAYEILKKSGVSPKAVHDQDSGPRRPRPPSPRMPPTVIGEVRLTLKDAFSGKHAEVPVEALVSCTACDGQGAVISGWRPCTACRGTGETGPGFFGNPFGSRRKVSCAACGGSGQLAVPISCPVCHGMGARIAKGRIPISIPPGIQDAAFLQVPGWTDTAAILVRIRRNAALERRGDDLVAVRRISAKRAKKGTTVTVTNVDGSRIRVRVPPRTDDGTCLRLKGRGMTRIGGGRGDLLVRVEMSARKEQSAAS